MSYDYYAPTDPVEAVTWMNERHAAVQVGDKILILCEPDDPTAPARWMTSIAFKEFYANQFLRVLRGNVFKEVNLATYWLTHRERRTLKGGIVFDPTDRVDRSHCYNLWSGFAPLALQQQIDHQFPSWFNMQQHTQHMICGGDEELFDYVMGWMATGVQFPDRPAGVALVLRGDEGSGKGIFARWYGQLFGRHWVHLTDGRQLTGTFNAHLEDAIVVFADEAIATSDKTTSGKLKGLITEPTVMIEAKYRNAHQVPNHIRVIMASNDDWVVPAGKDARRYCVLDVSGEHLNDTMYFAAIEHEMQTEGMGAMLNALLAYDLSNFSITDIPRTAALLDQKLHSLSPQWSWWMERLRIGKLAPDHLFWRTTISRQELRDEFSAAMRSAAIEQRTAIQVGMGAARLLSDVLPDPYPRDGGSVNGDRKWIIPSLADCRAHFERLLGHGIWWDETVAKFSQS